LSDVLGRHSAVITEKGVVAGNISGSLPSDLRFDLDGHSVDLLTSRSPVKSVAAVSKFSVFIDIGRGE